MTRQHWMAHPKRRDHLRLVVQALIGLLILFGATVAIPLQAPEDQPVAGQVAP